MSREPRVRPLAKISTWLSTVLKSAATTASSASHGHNARELAVVRTALQNLRSCDGMTRNKYAAEVIACGQIAIEPLLTLLNDRTWYMRYWAAYSLQKLGATSAIARLDTCAAHEPDSAVREMMLRAIESLRVYKSPAGGKYMSRDVCKLAGSHRR